MLTTISYNPSSILITRSLFLLTLIWSSFSSLDSTIPTPFHSCSFAPLRSNLQPPPTISLCPPFHLTHTTLQHFSFPSYPPSSFLFPSPSQHSNCPFKFKCPNAAYKTTFMATQYYPPQKYREENNRTNRTVCYGPSFIG